MADQILTELRRATLDLVKEEEEKVFAYVEKVVPGLTKRVEDGLKYLDIIDEHDYLQTLWQDVAIYNNLRDVALNLRVCSPYQRILSNELRVMDRIEEVTPAWYKQDLVMDATEVVNGYKLRGSTGMVVSFADYRRLCDVWDGKRRLEDGEWFVYADPCPEPTFEEFLDLFEDQACTDWKKMDEHGVCFGGFYAYPDGSYEKENAWELTGLRNCKKMWELPFPKRALLMTMKLGCDQREESVADSNSMCVYLQRKRAQYGMRGD